jgi:nucleoside-diphosphate-sugar epimerase
MSSGEPDSGFWRGKAVVVTGGGGFLGAPAVRLLESLGAEVRTIRSADHDLRDQRAARDAVDGAEWSSI